MKQTLASRRRRVACKLAEDLRGEVSDMSEKLAAIRDDVSRPEADADRAELLHALQASDTTLKDLVLSRKDSLLEFDVPTVRYLDRALAHLDAATTSRQLGLHPFPLLFQTAIALGMAIQASHTHIDDRKKKSGKNAAAPRLRELVKAHPLATAAALQRMLEAETGGKIDASTARAVVRDTKAKLARS